MIRVIALLTAKPGRRDEVLAAVRDVVPAVRAERGCIEYEPVVDDADFGGFQTKMGPDAYAVIETWADAEALRAHSVAPHMKEFGARTRDLMASRVAHVLSPI
ncbi:MAG TPA: putative quinol monooxygenase [Roseiarcus sp.]|jgi:quinol monooxygenase YgiN|nr:putative quinol monooxygenase [Roseiarcus sp.]